MKFDAEFETDVLAASMKSLDYLRKASSVLEHHHLATEQHSWVWNEMREHYLKFRERLGVKHLVVRAKSAIKDEEALSSMLRFVKKIATREPESPRAALEDLTVFVKAVNIQKAMEDGAKALEKGETEKAYEALDIVKTLRVAREYSRVRWFEEFDNRQAERKHFREHPDEYKYVPTGFKSLDRVIKGVQPGELGLFMATTGVGKSISLTNIGYHAMKYGHKTAYFSLEMPAKQVAARLDARWLGMSYRKLKFFDFSADELRALDRRKEKRRRHFGGMFEIIAMPLRAANIDWISNTLDDLGSEGFEPDLVIVDSGDHLKARRRYDSYRLEQAEVYWELKALALDRELGMWSSTQAGREWAGRKATAEATSEAYDKARIADLVISLNMPTAAKRTTRDDVDDDEDDDEGDSSTAISAERAPARAGVKRMQLHVAKYRDGASHMTFDIEADYEKMYIHDLETPEDVLKAEAAAAA